LDFPSYNFTSISEDSSDAKFNELRRLLISLRKPQDISADHIAVLNLKVESEVPITSIVPEERLKSLPPLPWEHAASPSSQGTPEFSPRLMGNGNPYPPREKFDMARKELLFDNNDAFREVCRMSPLPDRQRVKVTHARKFWIGLERMSEYWDTSFDNYFQQPSKQKEPLSGQEFSPAATHNRQSLRENDGGLGAKMDIDDEDANADTSPDSGKESLEDMYTGRRIGAGHEMPEEFREETLRGFVELVAWPFGCQAVVPSLPPRLAVRNLLFPVRQNFIAGRSPQDRQTARKGVLEGPVFVAQYRAETSFRETSEAIGCGQKEMCDLLREVGVMLLTAQERAREGKMEVRPGEGKWWTTTPRWGGAPDKGVTGDGSNSDSKPEPDTSNASKRSKFEHPILSSRKPAHLRKLSTAEKWKILQPGPGLWDRRMKYMQIGKPKDSPFDDVSIIIIISYSIWFLSFVPPGNR
jgi:hypothetical protein